MTIVVCDASILLKLLVEEEDTSRAKSLVSSYRVSAPDIAVAEVGNALWARVHDGRLNSNDGEELLEKFLDLPLDVRPLGPHVDAAFKIACRLDHPIYDCFYLALAESLSVPFVSADRRFIVAIRRSGIRTTEVKLLSDA